MENTLLRFIGNAAAFVFAAVLMEFIARWMHKYVMHRYGWCLHYDHHNYTGRVFQKNDLYALFFAVLSFVLIYFGLKNQMSVMASAGFGVALYGVGYVLFHEIIYHHRIKWLKIKPKNVYLRRIINAHRVHHAAATKGGAVNFSFLWAPKKYAPGNEEEIRKQMAEIHAMQLALRRREKEREEEREQVKRGRSNEDS